MRALVYEGPNKVSLRDDVTVRDPADGEVQVRIVASGLCHSDVSVVNGTIAWPAPSVLGHEGAGIIETVGAGVTDLKPGDPVVLHTLAHCGRCAHCSAGRPTHCRRTLGNRSEPFERGGQAVGNFAATSTFAERTVVKQQQAVRIDPNVPLDVACLIGCGVLTGVGSVIHRADVAAGETAAVFGIGGVGLNVIQGLRLAGASRIIAVDILPEREAMARQFGATDFVDASQGNSVEQIRALVPDPVSPGASGVDWTFECSGNRHALADAVAALGWGGNCLIVGVPAAGTSLDLPIGPMGFVDRGIMGVRYGSSQPQRDIPAMIALYSGGRLMLDELVTRRYALEDYEQAFHDLEHGKLARGVFVF
ncbi:Zn-dependent alcohol dehydrogenase [Flavisphingomonas formosensis]|uniref:Zn-dependent alcohol dehydrogenase n=1 Tax=Flavisphingomonas formosensis TaxID=861534 RepID=UPI0012F7B2E8|nr:Zn-dependent alcohol dehydrogenase [Sphingomonas formosensis]